MKNIEKSKQSTTSQVLSGSIWSSIAAAIQRIGGLIFTVIIARYLLPEGFGIFNLAVSVGLIFFMLSQVGIDKSLIYYFSNSLKKGNEKKAKDYFTYTLKIKLSILAFLSLMLGIFLYPLSVYIFKKPEMVFPLFLVIFYMFFLSLDQFLASFFFSVKKVKYIAVKELIFQLLKISLSLLFLVFLIKNPTAYQAFLILIASSFLAIAISIYNINKVQPGIFKLRGELSLKEKSRVLKFAYYLTIASIATVIIGNVDTITLGVILEDAKYIGIYQAAFVLMSSISGLLGFGQVLLPVFIEAKKQKLEYIFNKSLRYSMMLSFPIAFGLASLGSYFIVLIYGYEYIEGAFPLYFLAMFIFLAAQVSLITQLFSSREKPKDYFNLILLIIIIDIILNAGLVYFLSKYSDVLAITGAAIATTFTWLVYCIGMTVLARKRLGVRIKWGIIIKPLSASIIMVISIYVLKVLFGDINLFNGILLVSSGATVYILALMMLKGLDSTDYFILKLAIEKIKDYFIKTKVKI